MRKNAGLLTGIAVAALALAQAASAAEPANTDPNFGMPREVAAQAKERCAKQTDSYSLQAACMRMEKDGYEQMRGARSNLNVPYAIEAEAAKASARASDKEPGRLAVCPPPHRMTEKDGCR